MDRSLMNDEIKSIKTEKDYYNALSLVEKLWDAKLGTKEGNALEALVILIEKYEEENFKIDAHLK